MTKFRVLSLANRVTTLMHDLLINSGEFSKHVDRATASFSSIALFGQRSKTTDDFWATVSQLSEPTMSNVLTDAGCLRGDGGGMSQNSG